MNLRFWLIGLLAALFLWGCKDPNAPETTITVQLQATGSEAAVQGAYVLLYPTEMDALTHQNALAGPVMTNDEGKASMGTIPFQDDVFVYAEKGSEMTIGGVSFSVTEARSNLFRLTVDWPTD